ncbi:MAG: capsule assembly Wzi family protein [Verrucomicrobia bacterium]|nr:capsule assembly Wzi family protein [Verrucomicrobiota bacterium]
MRAILLTWALCGAAAALPAQQAPRVRILPMPVIGGEGEERRRIGQLLGDSANDTPDRLSPSTLLAHATTWTRDRFTILTPSIRTVSNSALPFSLNEGSLWAGRGLSTLAVGGFAARLGSVHLVVAPEFTRSENTRFQVIPFSDVDPTKWSIWANPFHPLPSSIDLPLRFGDQPLQRTTLGQSSLTVELPAVAVGVATENEWWGPSTRNALVLSNNAPGFLHAFVRTRHGIRTRAGTFRGQWLLGELRESDFFDRNADNNLRSMSGFLLSWTSRADSGLTLGLSRAVIATASPNAFPFGAAFDVLRDVGRPNTVATDRPTGNRDQLFSLFGRWLVPKAGFAVYGEWVRFEQPASLRDFLEFPGHSQGYTVGIEWARRSKLGALRVQGEATYLEPDPSLRLRPVGISYTSAVVPQGYTNRGMSLGAAIGPGASSQHLAADFFGAKYRAGIFFGRIRWDNAVLWTPVVPDVKNEDLSLFGGASASLSLYGVRAEVRFTRALRLDYLFQDKIHDYARGTHAGVDIRNSTLALTFSSTVIR